MTGGNTWLHRWVAAPAAAMVCLGAVLLGGCPQPEYTQRIEGVTLERIRAITEAPTTEPTPEQKIKALKDLGIEDEQLIELLLGAYPPA